MKFLKGCLIALIFFIVVCVIGWLFLENNVIGNLASLNQKVEKSWEIYIANLRDRNTGFTQQGIENDSLKHYSESSNRLIDSKDSQKELELNEYKFNKIAISNNLQSSLNDKLNSSLDNYNQAVRDYNVYRVRFPNSIIARRMNFRKSYKYFEIRYGIDNEKVMERKQKVENWIKNGGAYPE